MSLLAVLSQQGDSIAAHNGDPAAHAELLPKASDKHCDLNSAIPGDIVGHPAWMGYTAGNASWNPLPQPHYAPLDGLLDGFLLSTQGTGDSGAWLVYTFFAPPGATSATFTFRGKTTTGTATVRGGINTSNGSESGVTEHTLTTTAATFSQTVAVTAGSQYWVHFERNGTSDTAIVGRPTLTFAGASGVFAADYVRLDFNPKTLSANAETRLTQADALRWGCRISPNAEFVLWTNATSAVLEAIVSEADSALNRQSDIQVFENDRLVALVGSGTASGVIKYAELTLSSGWKRLTIRNSEGVTGAGFDASFHMRALYIPASAGYTRLSEPDRRLVIIGDSIISGYDSEIQDTIPNSGVSACLLAKYPGIGTSYAKQGARLNDITGAAAVRAAYVQRWLSAPASDVVIALGVNDYGQSTVSAANFATQYGELLDEIHIRAPGARVWCVTPIPKTVETANSLGSTLPDYRAAIVTAVSSRTSYASVIDGTAIVSAADLWDGTHIKKARQMKYAMAVINAMGVGYTGS